MRLPSWMRSLAVSLFRLYPREHGKYTILTKVFNRLFADTQPQSVIFRTRHSFILEADLSEFLQSWIYVFGAYELPTVRFIRSYLKAGDVAVDVGAQIGYLTLVMATADGGTTSVYSFEPEKNNIARFLRNMELNNLKNVTLLPKAASEHPGTIRLYLSADANAGTHSTVFVEGNVSERFIEIPCTTIDLEMDQQQVNRLDLMKIDVEGGEIDVLHGASETLQRFHPVVIAELSDVLQQARGTTCKEFKQKMVELGFNSYTINEDGSLVPSALDAPHPMDNVVFVTADRLSRVRVVSAKT